MASIGRRRGLRYLQFDGGIIEDYTSDWLLMQIVLENIRNERNHVPSEFWLLSLYQSLVAMLPRDCRPHPRSHRNRS